MIYDCVTLPLPPPPAPNSHTHVRLLSSSRDISFPPQILEGDHALAMEHAAEASESRITQLVNDFETQRQQLLERLQREKEDELRRLREEIRDMQNSHTKNLSNVQVYPESLSPEETHRLVQQIALRYTSE